MTVGNTNANPEKVSSRRKTPRNQKTPKTRINSHLRWLPVDRWIVNQELMRPPVYTSSFAINFFFVFSISPSSHRPLLSQWGIAEVKHTHTSLFNKQDGSNVPQYYGKGSLRTRAVGTVFFFFFFFFVESKFQRCVTSMPVSQPHNNYACAVNWGQNILRIQ